MLWPRQLRPKRFAQRIPSRNPLSQDFLALFRLISRLLDVGGGEPGIDSILGSLQENDMPETIQQAVCWSRRLSWLRTKNPTIGRSCRRCPATRSNGTCRSCGSDKRSWGRRWSRIPKQSHRKNQQASRATAKPQSKNFAGANGKSETFSDSSSCHTGIQLI
jgi:hypothetical protein